MEQTGQHTPGPYLIEGKTVYALNEEEYNRFDAQVHAGYHNGHRTSDEEVAAIVRLFATAPDLLEDAEYINMAIGGEPDEEYADDEVLEIRITGAAIKQLKAHIAAAQGR